MDSLFIKKIKTPGNGYVYDVCSNEIVKVNPLIYDLIDQFHLPFKEILQNLEQHYSKTKIREAYRFVKNAVNSGYFSSLRPEIKSDRKDMRELSYLFENAGIQQLIIDLTNQCNMRCRYCTFSGHYKYQRNHSGRKINRKTALKAVDYFIENSDKKEIPFVTFYGGEPLLRFKLFKEIVDYVKSHEKKFHFSLTTNGTLLDNEEICLFLIENDVSINISLDGPEYIHDKNRKMADGAGSYHRILRNLSWIKKRAPGYFYKNIFFSPVLTPPYDLERINAFFYKSDFFKNYKNPLNMSTVSLFATTFLDMSEIPGAIGKYRENRDKMLERYRDALISGRYEGLIFEEKLFKDIINTVHFRKKFRLEDSLSIVGQCTPGIRRLFVSADGKFYICEKIGEYYPIGDVYNGVDLEKVYGFFDACDHFFRECGNCWAVRLCKRCFADVNRENEFDEERKNGFCRSKSVYLETILEVYCAILEKNPNAFDCFKADDIL